MLKAIAASAPRLREPEQRPLGIEILDGDLFEIGLTSLLYLAHFATLTGWLVVGSRGLVTLHRGQPGFTRAGAGTYLVLGTRSDTTNFTATVTPYGGGNKLVTVSAGSDESALLSRGIVAGYTFEVNGDSFAIAEVISDTEMLLEIGTPGPVDPAVAFTIKAADTVASQKSYLKTLADLRAVPVARLLSSLPPDHPVVEEPAGAAAERCVDGMRWRWDGVDFEVLHPPPDYYQDALARTNDLIASPSDST